mgnify:CR=1 FL=1
MGEMRGREVELDVTNIAHGGISVSRLEGRVALDEVLNRFPDWEVDEDNVRVASTSTVRGFETMPVLVR